MKINHIYNKSVTCLEPGEIVAERYNGSNAGFAIFKTIDHPGTVAFESLKDFEYISWGDGDITFGPTKDAASHMYLEAEGKKEFTIVVYGIKDFGSGKPYSNLFSYNDNIKEAYFGDGVKIWSDSDAGGFKGCCKEYLEAVKNISYIPNDFCSGVKSLKEITFNRDCDSIRSGAFKDMYTHDSYKGAYKGIVIPNSIKEIQSNAFAYANVFACIEHTEIPEGYSTTGNNIKCYSEAEPSKFLNQYWHYNEEGVPILWTWKTFSCKIDENTIKKYTYETGMPWGGWITAYANGTYNVDGWVIKDSLIYQNSESDKPLKDSSGNIITAMDELEDDLYYF